MSEVSLPEAVFAELVRCCAEPYLRSELLLAARENLRARQLKCLKDNAREKERRRLRRADRAARADAREADRELENGVILERLGLFRRMIECKKSRISSAEVRMDFESEAMLYFHRSVRLNLSKWLSGGMNFTLRLLIKNSFCRVLQRHYRLKEGMGALIDDFRLRGGSVLSEEAA
jgi:hypothetical protein